MKKTFYLLISFLIIGIVLLMNFLFNIPKENININLVPENSEKYIALNFQKQK